MDWTAFRLSVVLALWTLAILLPLAVWLGRILAYQRFPGRGFVEAAVALPLVLPPTALASTSCLPSAPSRRWAAPGRGCSATASPSPSRGCCSPPSS